MESVGRVKLGSMFCHMVSVSNRTSTTSSSAVYWRMKMICFHFDAVHHKKCFLFRLEVFELRSVSIQSVFRHYASVKHYQRLQGWQLTDCRSVNFPKSGIKEGCSWFPKCSGGDIGFFWSDLFLHVIKYLCTNNSQHLNRRDGSVGGNKVYVSDLLCLMSLFC